VAGSELAWPEDKLHVHRFVLLSSTRTHAPPHTHHRTRTRNIDSSPLAKSRKNRYTTGHGQQEGGLSIELHNGNDVPLTANVLQVVPAYVRYLAFAPFLHGHLALTRAIDRTCVPRRLYFHTLAILLNDTELNAAERSKGALAPPNSRIYHSEVNILITLLDCAVLTHQWVRPAEDRAEPAHMELSLTLPPHSKIG
jgi:hypothetical protein